MQSASTSPSLICGPITGFDREDLKSKTAHYKIFVVSNKSQSPIFVFNQSVLKETLYKVNEIVFERFCVTVPMQDARSIFSYTINDKTFNIKVPGSKENRVFDFNSCNGFQTPADADKSKDPQHVWRIVQEMVGLGLAPDIIIYGGDQGYFDPVWKTPPLAAWSALQRENREEALQQPFTPEMEKAADDYYRNAYILPIAES